MEEMLFHVGGVVAPVLLCVLVGYGLAALKLPFDHKVSGALVANVGYPALVLAHLTEQHVPLGAFLEMMLAALVAVASFGLIALGLLALLSLPIRAFLSPMMLNNVGAIGLPICMLAFGDEGLAYAMAFVVVTLVGSFTIGTWLPMGRVALHDVLRKPVIYAALLAIAFMATDTRLPTPIDHTLGILGGLAIPLMLLTLGHTLASLSAGVLWRGGYLALLHLAMAAGVAFGVVQLFGLQGAARGVFILQCVMPVSVTAYLWIEMYDAKDAPGVASFILFSTVLAVAVLPLVLTFWV